MSSPTIQPPPPLVPVQIPTTAVEISHYVIIAIWNRKTEQLVLTLKDRPTWQAGRLNLPGGRVEPDETPIQAAAREGLEETGLVLKNLREMGVIESGPRVIIHVFLAHHPLAGLVPREGETETSAWYPVREALRDRRLIPNLSAILPVTLGAELEGWVWRETDTTLPSTDGDFVRSRLS